MPLEARYKGEVHIWKADSLGVKEDSNVPGLSCPELGENRAWTATWWGLLGVISPPRQGRNSLTMVPTNHEIAP